MCKEGGTLLTQVYVKEWRTPETIGLCKEEARSTESRLNLCKDVALSTDSKFM